MNKTVEDSFFEEWFKILQDDVDLNVQTLKAGLEHSQYMYYVGKVQQAERILLETKSLLKKFYPD